MTSYTLISFCLWGLVLVVVVKTIKFAFSSPGSWMGEPDHCQPTPQGSTSKPVQQLQLQANVSLKQTRIRENEHPLGVHTNRVELPTVQPSATTKDTERDIEEIMQEVERLLGLNRVSSQEKEALSAHQRGYFAHQHAAKYQLSQRNMDGFKRELKCARYELADLEEILDKYRTGSGKPLGGHSIR